MEHSNGEQSAPLWWVSVDAALDAATARRLVFTQLLAQRAGAGIGLRFDDATNPEVSALETAIADDSNWLAITVGASPVRTSARTTLYREYAEQLIGAGHASSAGGLVTLRVAPGSTTVEDAVRGPVLFDNGTLGEIVLVYSDGAIDAAFADAVDDAVLGTPLHVREDRALERTARALLVQRALSLTSPRYAHIGALLPDDGAELPSIAQLRADGFLPDAVVEHLALLGWSSPDGDDHPSRADLMQTFGLERVAHAPAHFNAARLRALNERALRALPPEHFAALIASAMQRAGLLEDPIPAAAERWIGTFVEAYGSQFATLADGLAIAADLRAEAVVVPAFELERLRNRQVVFYLDAVGQYVDAQAELRELPLEADLPNIAQEFGVAHDDAFAAVRMALSGKHDGPPLRLLFPLLGHDRILIRIGAISSHLLHGRGLEPVKFGPGGVPFETMQTSRPLEG